MKKKIICLLVIIVTLSMIAVLVTALPHNNTLTSFFKLVDSNTTYFDTEYGEYPSIAGIFNGTIKPLHEIQISGIYTYPCIGTGGHSEYIKIWNERGIVAEANWSGYQSDWHNITFSKPVTLLANKTYNCTIRTGSYPQIRHTKSLRTLDGWLNCSSYIDINGNIYNDWIPCIKLWN